MNKRKFDYRHIVCIVITLALIACAIFGFTTSLGRTIESGRDFGLSIGYFFCEFFEIENTITPTVNNPAKIPFFTFGKSDEPSVPVPITPGEQITPEDVNEWIEFWKAFQSKETLFGYFRIVLNVLRYAIIVFILLLLVRLVVKILLKQYFSNENDDSEKESFFLQSWKKIISKPYLFCKAWVLSFIAFVKEHKYYKIIWILLILLMLNVYTLVLEFFAVFFYTFGSFDFSGIGVQFDKLYVDLKYIFTGGPVPLVVFSLFYFFYVNARSVAFDRLRHRERKNRGFLNELGIINNIYGYVGAGKTSLATDMTLSWEVQFITDALEVILEVDSRFPYFPWSNLEKELKEIFSSRKVHDVFQVRRLIKAKQNLFENDPDKTKIYGYDYLLYGLTFDNKLYEEYIWEAISDYACAYFVYMVQSSFIVSNYSIRSDIVRDMGFFPLYDTDFFSRDSKLLEAYSRHSHILDFDMLRLGKIMLENNPNRNAFGFGIYDISEIDKECGNAQTLQEVKRNSEECNPKNDLFAECLKMSRHACIIRNRVFVRIVADLQRLGSLASNIHELGDKIEVYDKNEFSPVLPIYSPFWFLDGIFYPLAEKIDNYYVDYKNVRADRTLFMYLLHGFSSKIKQYHDKTYNLFGSQTVKLHVENGLRQDNIKEKKWYRQSKKIYSKRYATDCMNAIFEKKSENNNVGLDDLDVYSGDVATPQELAKQHSHFQQNMQKSKIGSFYPREENFYD